MAASKLVQVILGEVPFMPLSEERAAASRRMVNEFTDTAEE